MRENRMLRLTWRELETWPGWNCEPTEQSKELDWKPSTYGRRASLRPYWREADGKGLYPEYLAGGPPYPISSGGTSHSPRPRLAAAPS